MKDCLFCRIVERSIPAKVVHEDDAMLAFEDIAPQAPVHLLVIPKTHVASLNEVAEGSASDREMLGRMLATARALARSKGIDATGYRVVLNTLAGAGQSVFHIHTHLLGGRTFSWPPG